MEVMKAAISDSEAIIKSEDDAGDIKIEREAHECVACAILGDDHYDIYCTHTTCARTTLHDFMCRFTGTDVVVRRHMCRTCYQLVDTLERAELEYNRLKTEFEAILAKNSSFDHAHQNDTDDEPVKTETFDDELDDDWNYDPNQDSDDEPLLIIKRKKRRIGKRKKKSPSAKSKTKRDDVEKRGRGGVGRRAGRGAVPPERGGGVVAVRQPVAADLRSDSQQWECGVCGVRSTSEWEATEHASQHHPLDDDPCKDEPRTPNGLNHTNGMDDSYITPDRQETADEEVPPLPKSARVGASLSRRANRARFPKTVYSCDQCDAKYTSLARFRYHKEKHEISKPPFICEICGAHYKHKKACDIHVAMHKGISDWKCEECDKLFPSKGALQRHNNIHTGKLNYQCDLCGKSFIHTSSFKMHKLSHTGMKPHACDVCGLALMTRSHLKRHKRVHSGEKRHECKLCGKRFSERYNLVAHAKSHDVGNQAPNGEGETPPAPPRRRLFRCYLCEERFERRYMLERHMETTHQRSLEKQPPKPRNTMTKLLKAQAAASKAAETQNTRGAVAESAVKSPAASETSAPSQPALAIVKDETRPLVLVLTAGGGGVDKPQPNDGNGTVFASGWGGAFAAGVPAEYALRMPHFSH